jgi:ATP-dependent RNA helicase DOB1
MLMDVIELIAEQEAQKNIQIPDEALVSQYYEYRQQLDTMASDFREIVTHPAYSLPFMRPGRLVKVKHGKLDFGWGIVVNYQKRLPPKVSSALMQRRV